MHAASEPSEAEPATASPALPAPQLPDRLNRWAAWLVLPLAGLLLAQWPLRDWVQAGSRSANDAAQILFALYGAVAVSAATRRGLHLAVQHGAGDTAAASATGWRAWAMAACLLPWALLGLWGAVPQVWRSTLGLERFSEGLSPGYFLIRWALLLMLVLVLLSVLAPGARRLPAPLKRLLGRSATKGSA